MLDDLGWYVVDNLPTSLVNTVVDLAAKPGSGIDRLALVAGRRHTELLTTVSELRAEGHRVTVVFLDASTPDIVKRYDATRSPTTRAGWSSRSVSNVARSTRSARRPTS